MQRPRGRWPIPDLHPPSTNKLTPLPPAIPFPHLPVPRHRTNSASHPPLLVSKIFWRRSSRRVARLPKASGARPTTSKQRQDVRIRIALRMVIHGPSFTSRIHFLLNERSTSHTAPSYLLEQVCNMYRCRCTRCLLGFPQVLRQGTIVHAGNRS